MPVFWDFLWRAAPRAVLVDDAGIILVDGEGRVLLDGPVGGTRYTRVLVAGDARTTVEGADRILAPPVTDYDEYLMTQFRYINEWFQSGEAQHLLVDSTTVVQNLQANSATVTLDVQADSVTVDQNLQALKADVVQTLKSGSLEVQGAVGFLSAIGVDDNSHLLVNSDGSVSVGPPSDVTLLRLVSTADVVIAQNTTETLLSGPTIESFDFATETGVWTADMLFSNTSNQPAAIFFQYYASGILQGTSETLNMPASVDSPIAISGQLTNDLTNGETVRLDITSDKSSTVLGTLQVTRLVMVKAGA